MKELTLNNIEEIIEAGEYGYYGIRSATTSDMERIAAGETYLECSHVWVDGTMTDEMLDGTCAIGVTEWDTEADIAKKIAYTSKTYAGKTLLLIADKNCEYGEDNGEVILGSNGCGADVIGIITM